MTSSPRILIGTAMLTAACVAAPTSALAEATPCPLPTFGPGTNDRPIITPAEFTARVTNPWFPLKREETLVYSGVKDGRKALDLVLTSARTRRIDGVRTRVVEDRLYLDDVLEERTSDYYAQDRCGNVWYFGEDTATLDVRGRVTSTEGSFHAGVDGALPGVFMEARPELGRRFRQEWYRGHAEDTFWVTRRSAGVTVPFGSFGGALLTHEATALEPAVLDAKYYVRGVGEVAELSLKGPREQLRLVEIIR
jgi:hypothetical protein